MSYLQGICHPFAHLRQFDFLSDGAVFKVDICEKNLDRDFRKARKTPRIRGVRDSITTYIAQRKIGVNQHCTRALS